GGGGGGGGGRGAGGLGRGDMGGGRPGGGGGGRAGWGLDTVAGSGIKPRVRYDVRYNRTGVRQRTRQRTATGGAGKLLTFRQSVPLIHLLTIWTLDYHGDT